jgi:hypothetical protein
MSPVIDKPVLDLVTKTSKLNDTIRARRIEMQQPPPYTYVLLLFDRCCSMLGAIRMNLAHDFVHEAIVLARPLFTDSLALTEIASSDENRRKELAVGMVMAGIDDGRGLFQSLASRGDDVDAELANLAEERAMVQAYAQRHGLSTRIWRPDDHAKDLATKHGRIGEYDDLRVANYFVHGSTKALEQRLSIRDDETAVVGDPAAGFKPWANPTGRFAVHSSLYATRSACLIFGWTEPPELAALGVELGEARAAAERDEV